MIRQILNPSQYKTDDQVASLLRQLGFQETEPYHAHDKYWSVRFGKTFPTHLIRSEGNHLCTPVIFSVNPDETELNQPFLFHIYSELGGKFYQWGEFRGNLQATFLARMIRESAFSDDFIIQVASLHSKEDLESLLFQIGFIVEKSSDPGGNSEFPQQGISHYKTSSSLLLGEDNQRDIDIRITLDPNIIGIYWSKKGRDEFRRLATLSGEISARTLRRMVLRASFADDFPPPLFELDSDTKFCDWMECSGFVIQPVSDYLRSLLFHKIPREHRKATPCCELIAQRNELTTDAIVSVEDSTLRVYKYYDEDRFFELCSEFAEPIDASMLRDAIRAN